MVELIQLSSIYEGGRLLAWFETDAHSFLYPYPSYSINYSTGDRDIIMERNLDFPVSVKKMSLILVMFPFVTQMFRQMVYLDGNDAPLHKYTFKSFGHSHFHNTLEFLLHIPLPYQ